MIFNDGLPFKGFMEEVDDFNDFAHTGRVPYPDTSHQPLGGGSNGGNREADLSFMRDPVKDENAELKEMNENLRKRHSKIINRTQGVIEFLKIESKIPNSLVIEFLESIINDSIDVEKIKSKVNKITNSIERRLDNIED